MQFAKEGKGRMNGETYQICRLTAEMKRAIKENRALTYEPLKYENQIKFQFLPRRCFWGMQEDVVYDPGTWFEKCKKPGIRDVKMLIPTKVQERNLLGFSNTSHTSILVFLESGEVRYWMPQWEFDSKLRMWNIIYTEAVWKDAPKGIPSFQDNTKEFLEILQKIEKFANVIGESYFANVFQEAAAILAKEKELEFNENLSVRPPLPEQMKPIFDAASKADVFGAMGSWNDSPPYMAHKKGLSEEYNELSDKLLTQIRFAILYAINEW